MTVKDPDPRKVGRSFSNRAVEMILASYPGFYLTSPPTGESSYAVYWPTLVPNEHVRPVVVIDGERVPVEAPGPVEGIEVVPPEVDLPPAPEGPTETVPLGRLVGARSGDKGGNANLGVWARTPLAYAWLERFLTAERLRALLPEAQSLPVERYTFLNLWALNFVIAGLLGEGVASSTRSDPQAKSLGEYLRAKRVPVPVVLLGAG